MSDEPRDDTTDGIDARPPEPLDAHAGTSSPGDMNLNGDQSRPTGLRPHDNTPGNTLPGDAPSSDARSGDARPGDARSGDSLAGGARTGDARSDDDLSDDARSGDVRSDHGGSANAGSDHGQAADSQSDIAHADGSRTDVSAPWERPQRWKRGVPEAIGVEALLATLADTGDGSDRDNADSITARPAGSGVADVGGDTGDGVGGDTADDVPDSRRSRRPSSNSDSIPASQLIAALAAEPPADVVAQNSTPAVSGPASASDASPAGAHPGSEQTAQNRAAGSDVDQNQNSVVESALDSPRAAADDSRPVPDNAAADGAPDRPADSGRADATAAAGNPPPPGSGALLGLGFGRPPHRHRAWLYAGRTVAALVALATLLSVGVEWKIKDRAEVGLVDHQVTGALFTDDPSISTARTTQMVVTNSKGVKTTEAAPPKATYKPENILLIGSDTRSGANAAIGGSDPSTNGTSNSDTLMVAHVSGDREHVTILSIPRDTLVPAPHCKSWNSTTGAVSTQDFPVDPGEIFHINSAYAVGGPRCTITAVQSLTGLGITRMIGIDFQGFESMVSALGGITINICRPIVDQVLGNVAPKAGVQVVQGQQALNLVRARDVIGDTESDLARIHRQQVVLSAILRQVTQSGTLLHPSKLDNFLQAFTKSTFTQNVTLEDLVTLAGSLGSLDPAHVAFYTLPTTPSTTVDGALDVDRSKAAPVFDDLINDLPLPGEVIPASKPKPSTTSATPPVSANLEVSITPAQVALEIYNSAGQDQAAAMAQQKLNAVGFRVADNQLFTSDNTQSGTVVEFATTNRAAGLTVAAAVPGSTMVVTPGLGNTVRLLVGSSFPGTVKAVKIGQQAPASLSTAISTGPAIGSSSGGAPATSTSLSSVNAAAGTCA